MDKNTKDIIDTLQFIRDRMATKDDVRSIVHDEVPGIIQEIIPGIVALEMRPVTAELREVVRGLDTLTEHYRNLRGVTKEIDELRAEIGAIKRHLGLSTEIAA
jgi:GTP1/Obg family GTP-binding protein